jgi:hypothetical protein
MAIQASETEDFRDNSIVNSGGYVGCGQLGPWYHENPTYPRGSSSPLTIRGAGNEVHNLLRAGEYLCYIQSVLKTDRCEVVAAAYNAGENAVKAGLPTSGGVQGDIELIINNSSTGTAKKKEMREYVGCSCGGPLLEKYTKSSNPNRYCRPNGGGVAGIGDIDTDVLVLDKIADVGTGVIQALASVVGTAVILFDKHLGPALLSLVMTVYSIMALWAIAKLLMPFGKPGNAGQTMNGLLTLTGTVGIVALILNNLSLLTSLVFFPIMSMMTELGDLSASSCPNNSPLQPKCTAASAQSLSGDVGKDAKLLATRMTCTVDQAIQPLKQTLRVSMASLKRMESRQGLSGGSNVLAFLTRGSILGLALEDFSEKQVLAMRLMILASALPLAVMSATSILGIIATTAQAFWKIAFEFFKLAPAVAAFAFRPTRGVFSSSVKSWISPIMTFAVIYSMLGLSSTIVCGANLGDTSSGPLTMATDGEGYLKGVSQAPYSLGAELRNQKPGEAVFPVFTKTIWLTLAFFTVFMNSSLRLAAKMDWVGGGGLADGLSKLVSNTLGNLDHYKSMADKTLGMGARALQNAAMESGKTDKDDKDKDDKDNKKEGSGSQADENSDDPRSPKAEKQGLGQQSVDQNAPPERTAV